MRQQINNIPCLKVSETSNLSQIIAYNDINAKTVLFCENNRMFALIFFDVNRLEVWSKLHATRFSKLIA
jgi:hypothetical protein